MLLQSVLLQNSMQCFKKIGTLRERKDLRFCLKGILDLQLLRFCISDRWFMTEHVQLGGFESLINDWSHINTPDLQYSPG